jgi:uncharacterized HAD superfamily protein
MEVYMYIGIDIDGTIAGRNLQTFAAACSERFGFLLPDPSEHQLTYASLMNHPTMLAHRQASVEHFHRTLEEIEQAPFLHQAAPPLRGAVDAVNKLAQYANLGYYTVRKAHPPFTAIEIENATKNWLSEHQFPASGQVVFCMSLMNKWLQVYQHLRVAPEPFILIDDLAPQLYTAFLQLQAGHHPRLSHQECVQVTAVLQRHATLVAFGSTPSLAINNDLRVKHLPAWGNVDDFIAMLCASS